MSRKTRTLACILSGLTLSMSTLAFGEEEHVPSRAAWVDPVPGAASWLDTRTLNAELATPAILSTGGNAALAQLVDGGMYAVSEDGNVLGRIVLPENTVWYTLDAQDRILAHDGKQLYVAQNWEKAANASGYQNILDVSGVRSMDIGGNILVYADESSLNIVELESGSVKKLALSDFFNDEKMASLTPEAVEAAENAKNSKRSKKTGQKNAAESESVQVADIQGIWWRADGTGVIRVRSLMNVRTFVTADNGRSWRQMTDAPDEIVHEFGWIWNGEDRVLSSNGREWVKVCGKKFSVADRFTLSHRAEMADAVPNSWISLPEVAVPDKAEDAQSEETAPECVEVAGIPGKNAQMPSVVNLRQDGLYAPRSEETGFKMGLYRQSENSDLSAWMMLPEDGGIRPMALPAGCNALYAGAMHGLGIAMCDAGNDEVTVYSRTAQTDWVTETILPKSYSTDPAFMMSEDGTLVISGECYDDTAEVPVAASEDELASGLASVSTQTVTRHICNAAVRLPMDPGMEGIWRVEQIENAKSFVPLNAGRFVSIEGDAARSRMMLRTPTETQVLVEDFDSEPYQGIVQTQEGCFALYDGSVSEQTLRESSSPAVDPETGVAAGGQNVRLLSTQGRLSELDCASSRAIAEMGADQNVQIDEEFGDDRYGLRAGAGGFFSTGDVQTWNVKIEALFPIYHGQYEIAAIYRMAGGNRGSALGHIGLLAIRWRYDGFEHFDFAVGAGIGFGSLCGYKAPARSGEEGEEAGDKENAVVKESGYEKCSNLSMRYLISGIATYKLAEHWKLFVAAELVGGASWGFDLTGGIEFRF